MPEAWEIVAIGILVIGCIVAVAMTAVRLPGTWLILLLAVAFGWWGNWERIGLVTIGILGGIALIGEAIELLASVILARKVGATRQAAWGGLIGGVLGMFFLSFLGTLPIPVIGTLIGAVVGALVGCFLGAGLAEWSARKKLAQGTKVGLFSALGFVIGLATKIGLALAMSGVLIACAVWSPSGSDTSTATPSVVGPP